MAPDVPLRMHRHYRDLRGHLRTRSDRHLSSVGTWRSKQDIGGHDVERVRDREAPGFNPGPLDHFSVWPSGGPSPGPAWSFLAVASTVSRIKSNGGRVDIGPVSTRCRWHARRRGDGDRRADNSPPPAIAADTGAITQIRSGRRAGSGNALDAEPGRQLADDTVGPLRPVGDLQGAGRRS